MKIVLVLTFVSVCFAVENTPELYAAKLIRLVDGPSETEGRVEIFFKEKWRTICDDHWNSAEAQVACRQLGFGTAKAIPRKRTPDVYGLGSLEKPILLILGCDGTEFSLDQCRLNEKGDNFCGHDEDAGLKCELSVKNRVRLVGGRSASEGRVEMFYAGKWHTICADYWGIAAAQVVCRQLGLRRSDAVPGSKAYYGGGSRKKPILLAASCEGEESSLDGCHLKEDDEGLCNQHDAGVQCGQPVRPWDLKDLAERRLDLLRRLMDIVQK